MVDFDQVQRRLERLSPLPPPPPSPPWGSLILALLCFGATGAAWYYFNRPPQVLPDQTIADSSGHPQLVHFEAHNANLLKYTRLSDHTTHYLPLASLSPTLQQAASRVPSELKLDYPLECFMGDKDDPPATIRILGHSDDWVRYIRVSDNSTHYEPLQSFSTDDQGVLNALSGVLTVDTPLNHSFHDANGNLIADRLESRNADLVKFTTADGATLYFPVGELTSLDQSLIASLPKNLLLAYPFKCTVTGKDGKKMAIQLEGRNSSSLKYALGDDGRAYYAPVANFSLLDREAFQFFPDQLEYSFPFDYTLTDAKGQAHVFHLEDRNAYVVKFSAPDTGRVNYWPLRAFSTASQRFLDRLPSSLDFKFPFDATLTAQSGQPLEAHVLGRDGNSVQFQLADGNTYVYDLAKLSDDSQALLQLIPPNLRNLADPNVKTKRQFAVLYANLTELIKMEAQSRTDQESIIATSSDAANFALDAIRDKIVEACRQIDPLLDTSPKVGNAKLAQSTWSRAMMLVHQIDQIRVGMSTANPGDRVVKHQEVRKIEADLVGALNEIHGFIGTYVPPGPN